MRVIPLRWKISFWSAGVTALALLTFATGTLINLYHEQIEGVDEDLRAEAALLGKQEGPRQSLHPSPLMSYLIFNDSRQLVESTPGFPEEQARDLPRNKHPVDLKVGETPWRVGVYPIGNYTCVIAYNLDEVHDIVGDLMKAYLVSTPMAAVLAAIGGWFLAGRALAPVRAATKAAAEIGPGSMELRLPSPQTRDELGRLTEVLNSMLDRLEKSYHQAERFAADASHELRTPLTIMRGEIEALLSRGDLGPETEARIISLQEEIARLDGITENLLLLAKFDAGRIQSSQADIDLSRLLSEGAEDAEMLTAAGELDFVQDVGPGIHVQGNPALLQRLLVNLVDNACKFNQPGGRVGVSLTVEQGMARLRVSNTGPGIPSSLQPNLFKRFFRADASRGTRGHGLGLSLCREIATLHRGSLVLEKSDASLTVFTLSIPLEGDPSPSSRS